jgi:hypothetical protein
MPVFKTMSRFNTTDPLRSKRETETRLSSPKGIIIDRDPILIDSSFPEIDFPATIGGKTIATPVPVILMEILVKLVEVPVTVFEVPSNVNAVLLRGKGPPSGPPQRQK